MRTIVFSGGKHREISGIVIGNHVADTTRAWAGLPTIVGGQRFGVVVGMSAASVLRNTAHIIEKFRQSPLLGTCVSIRTNS